MILPENEQSTRRKSWAFSGKKSGPIFRGHNSKEARVLEGNVRKGDARHHPANRDGSEGDVENNGE
jgi:hypothetical protein